MRSNRPSPPYPFIFTSFILIISIQTCFCAGNDQYVNCNRPFLCATVQSILHPTLRFTVLPPPQLVVKTRRLAADPRQSGQSANTEPKSVFPDCTNTSSYAQCVASYKGNNNNKKNPYDKSNDRRVVVTPPPPPPTPFNKLIAPAPEPIVPSGVPAFTQSPSPTQFIAPAVATSPNEIGPHHNYLRERPFSKRNPLQKIAIGISGAVSGIVVISFVIIYSVKRRHFSSKSGANNFQINDEEFIKNYGSVAPKRYTYSDVKKLTNSFKEKVGQGGYGVVYKGKLPDGRMVAVKILGVSKGNGEEFINEVASISRTSHVNIVTLLGFCYERTKRALIYEFMPYGSLDKFIYDKGPPITNHHLDSKTMFRIAVGIARGLEYLHRGCNTRILHFDIKPHNILLDEDLHPKISDFGLAKLCKTKESIVSMTGMRGTAGFIAPEVFSRSFGGVSHKSDVYSYGMLVLEMIGGRKNFDGEFSHTSETYFPHWIYTKLEQDKNFDTFEHITEEAEEETTKKMIIVSLWCIQTNPSYRPSISKAIEMLEGNLQALPFPPKPFLDSPTRSP
ncbi:PR5-like receptor kinase isoform X3 [Alnus glutinosa]|uniref:PR5-like receptor kinase isoform X3 n=1 Tax=Alnus glutinosa TaxID=3517 RepID=UPI002D7762F7|nr:PR5-like receptor kinase isoform X3 [Alnus glutinosa]